LNPGGVSPGVHTGIWGPGKGEAKVWGEPTRGGRSWNGPNKRGRFAPRPGGCVFLGPPNFPGRKGYKGGRIYKGGLKLKGSQRARGLNPGAGKTLFPGALRCKTPGVFPFGQRAGFFGGPFGGIPPRGPSIFGPGLLRYWRPPGKPPRGHINVSSGGLAREKKRFFPPGHRRALCGTSGKNGGGRAHTYRRAGDWGAPLEHIIIGGPPEYFWRGIICAPFCGKKNPGGFPGGISLLKEQRGKNPLGYPRKFVGAAANTTGGGFFPRERAPFWGETTRG